MKLIQRLLVATLPAASLFIATAVAAAGHDTAPHGAVNRDTAGLHANHTPAPQFDEKSALAISQAAIGKTLENVELRDTEGRTVRLAELRGKPLVVSLIYTSCYHICPTTTQYLGKVVASARAALGPESFRVITVGFDTRNDNPAAMRNFAKQQGIETEGWLFLGGDAPAIERLAANLGFQYFASPKGFDHLVQATLIDADGRIVRQVYGMNFEMPQLIEPLKQLVFGERPGQGVLEGILGRVKLFCTVYDPSSDRYRLDYSLFLGMLIGFLIIASAVYYLFKEWRRGRG